MNLTGMFILMANTLNLGRRQQEVACGHHGSPVFESRRTSTLHAPCMHATMLRRPSFLWPAHPGLLPAPASILQEPP